MSFRRFSAEGDERGAGIGTSAPSFASDSRRDGVTRCYRRPNQFWPFRLVPDISKKKGGFARKASFHTPH
jgi:hypothetical protein